MVLYIIRILISDIYIHKRIDHKLCTPSALENGLMGSIITLLGDAVVVCVTAVLEVIGSIPGCI